MPDWHPQEILQHRVAVRVVAEPWVAPDVRQPDRTVAQESAEDAVDPRQVTDLGCPLLRDAHCQEAGKAAATIRDAERTVPGAYRRPRRAENPVQDTIQVQILGDGEEIQRGAVQGGMLRLAAL